MFGKTRHIHIVGIGFDSKGGNVPSSILEAPLFFVK